MKKFFFSPSHGVDNGVAHSDLLRKRPQRKTPEDSSVIDSDPGRFGMGPRARH